MRLMRLILALAGLFAATLAQAETRLALVVGNGAYTDVTALDNPVPDAVLMAETLRAKGFVVTEVTDADQAGLNRAISQFGRDLRGAGKDAVGLFFYAGHAVQSFGENYLLPVDATLTDAADLSLVGVQAEAVLRQMRSARNRTNIVILDACRNNPFQAIPELTDSGLAEMNAPTGTFLSYSTAPGAVALDGLDGNSPFTRALARQIPVAGMPIEQTFKNVRVEVIEKTGGQQTPWDTSSLTADFSFAPRETLSAADLQEKQLWDSVKVSDDPVQIMLFMRSYPAGRYQEAARQLLEAALASELGTGAPAGAGEQVAAALPEPARAATPSASEEEMIAAAQSSGAAADYEAYVAAYPEGVFAELAAFELKILREKAGQEAAAAAPAGSETAAPPANAPAVDVEDFSALRFDTPFPSGGDPVEGRSIAEIVALTPLFPPIEGLPEEVWKDHTCSTCHAWTQEALCTQGATYVGAPDDAAVAKPHPFGGVFKRGLRAWASAGCP
jgi:hypothetical protein